MESRSCTDKPGADDLATVREEAAAWLVRLDEARPEERAGLRAQCEAWQAADPRRRRVLEQMRRMWSALEPSPRRRRAAGALMLLLAVVAAGQLPWTVWTADHRTAPGEIRRVTLPDGSTVVLNSDSAMDIDYGDGARSIRLAQGELLVTVRRDPTGGPFSVRTQAGAAVALGTRYGVRLGDGDARVRVYESRVELVPRQAPERAAVLAPGDAARLTPAGVQPLASTGRRLPDWVHHQLVFNDAPLAGVVQRLRAYRRGWLWVDGDLPARDLRFTGALPADDSDAALALLADALGLKVQRMTPYLVWLKAGD